MKLTNGDIEQFLIDRPRSITYRGLCHYLLYPLQEWLKHRDLTPEVVKEYVKQRYENPKSHNTFLAVMKSFADWKIKRLPQDDIKVFIRDRQTLELIKDIRRDRVVVRLEKKELSVDELKMIFASLEKIGFKIGFSGLWSLAWFGCRPGELIELNLRAINKDPDTYLPESLVKEMRPGDYCLKFLTEKTVVERACFMDKFTKDHLEEFIKSGFGYKYLYDTCVDLQNLVGVKFTPKWFRSTFQTKMQRALMESGVPMVKLDLLVKVMSGHTVGPDITSVYTDYGSDIKKAMTELHYMKTIEKKLGKLTLDEDYLTVTERSRTERTQRRSFVEEVNLGLLRWDEEKQCWVYSDTGEPYQERPPEVKRLPTEEEVVLGLVKYDPEKECWVYTDTGSPYQERPEIPIEKELVAAKKVMVKKVGPGVRKKQILKALDGVWMAPWQMSRAVGISESGCRSLMRRYQVAGLLSRRSSTKRRGPTRGRRAIEYTLSRQGPFVKADVRQEVRT